MATMPTYNIKQIQVGTLPYELVAGYLQGESGAKDWEDIKSLVSGNFQFIISNAAGNTPKNVSWINSSGTTITGTLDANNAESPAIYFVPTDLRVSTDHAEYIAVGSAGSKTWEKIGQTEIDLSQYAKKSTITLTGNTGSAGGETIATSNDGAQSALGTATISYKKADAVTGSDGAGESANTGNAGGITIEGSNFSFTGTSATISIEATAEELLDHSFQPAGSIGGTVSIASHTHSASQTLSDSDKQQVISALANFSGGSGSFTQGTDTFTPNVPTSIDTSKFSGGSLSGTTTFVTGVTAASLTGDTSFLSAATVNNGVLSWSAGTVGISGGTASGTGTVGLNPAEIQTGFYSAGSAAQFTQGVDSHSHTGAALGTITYATVVKSLPAITIGGAGAFDISGASFSFNGTTATISHSFGATATVSLSTNYQPAGTIGGSQAVASHSHSYTKPIAHTHSIGLTDTTITGTAQVAVSSHTHSVTVASHTHSVSVSGNNYNA